MRLIRSDEVRGGAVPTIEVRHTVHLLAETICS